MEQPNEGFSVVPLGDTGKDIYLPTPDGEKVGQLNFGYGYVLNVNGTPEDVYKTVLACKEQESGFIFTDPIYGEKLHFTPKGIENVWWVGVTWVPHEQIKANALKAAEDQRKAEELMAAQRQGLTLPQIIPQRRNGGHKR